MTEKTPKPITHGSSAYSNSLCRCDICRAAWAEYMRPRLAVYRARQRANRVAK